MVNNNRVHCSKKIPQWGKKPKGFNLVELLIGLGISSGLLLATLTITANMQSQIKTTSILGNWRQMLSTVRSSYSTKNGCEAMFQGVVLPTGGVGNSFPTTGGVDIQCLGNQRLPAIVPLDCAPPAAGGRSYIKKAAAGDTVNFSSSINVISIQLRSSSSIAPNSVPPMTIIPKSGVHAGLPSSVYKYPVYLNIKANIDFLGVNGLATSSGVRTVNNTVESGATPTDPTGISFVAYVDAQAGSATYGEIISCEGNPGLTGTNVMSPIVLPILSPASCPPGYLENGPATALDPGPGGRMIIGLNPTPPTLPNSPRDFRNLKNYGGEEMHVLNGLEVPPHTHSVKIFQWNTKDLFVTGTSGAPGSVSGETNELNQYYLSTAPVGGIGNATFPPSGIPQPDPVDPTAPPIQGNNMGNYHAPKPLAAGNDTPYATAIPAPGGLPTNSSGAAAHNTMPPFIVVRWCYKQ